MEHLIWVWVGVVIVAIVCEAITEQLVSIWFLPGAVVSAILALCGVEFLWQALGFVVISAIAVPIGKIFLGGKKKNQDTRTNIDAIIGEKCIVQEKIDNYAGCGLVKIKGQLWSARGVSENDIFEAGEILSVVAIEGVKVICKKN